MHLILDSGNTRVKAGVFEKTVLHKAYAFSHDELPAFLDRISVEFAFSHGLVSDVHGQVGELATSFRLIRFSRALRLPFKNEYKTPDTLGTDRIAAIAAACSLFLKKNTLVIDAGTCIKYDFITDDCKYSGGSISPGISMRFQALHEFTGKLPLISPPSSEPIFEGHDTETSIISGVVGGAILEAQGFIDYYRQKYSELNVIITGGDGVLLSNSLNYLFDPDLVLRGLNEILMLNLPPQ